MARPSKFNEQICNELCSYYEEGLPQKTCADLCGIDRTTLGKWLAKGKNAKSGKYRDFYLRWCKAKAKFIQHHTNKIADNPSWLASQYLLQVTDPETYVVAEKQEMETTVKADITADVDMTDAEIHKHDLELLQSLLDDKHDNTDSRTDKPTTE
jgi:hypothetical protein